MKTESESTQKIIDRMLKDTKTAWSDVCSEDEYASVLDAYNRLDNSPLYSQIARGGDYLVAGAVDTADNEAIRDWVNQKINTALNTSSVIFDRSAVTVERGYSIYDIANSASKKLVDMNLLRKSNTVDEYNKEICNRSKSIKEMEIRELSASEFENLKDYLSNYLDDFEQLDDEELEEI